MDRDRDRVVMNLGSCVDECPTIPKPFISLSKIRLSFKLGDHTHISRAKSSADGYKPRHMTSRSTSRHVTARHVQRRRIASGGIRPRTRAGSRECTCEGTRAIAEGTRGGQGDDSKVFDISNLILPTTIVGGKNDAGGQCAREEA